MWQVFKHVINILHEKENWNKKILKHSGCFCSANIYLLNYTFLQWCYIRIITNDNYNSINKVGILKYENLKCNTNLLSLYTYKEIKYKNKQNVE